MASTPEERFLATQKAMGPKAVKTEEIEITAHDPMVVQKLAEKHCSKPTSFATLGGVKVVPRNVDCSCE